MKKFFKLFLFLFFIFNIGFCNAANLVDINFATLEELETLTGIGAVKAQAIIDTRPYMSVDDLINVSGIGEKTLAKIKEQGLACVNCKATEGDTDNTVIHAEAGIQDESDGIDSGLRQNDTGIEGTTTKTESEIITYPTGILINEVLPSAPGSDETGEWIELYNSNNFEVDLSGWAIKDTSGTVKNFTIPSGTAISAYGFLIFYRPQTKITLNNDGDGLVLQNPNDKVVSSADFSKATTGYSWARFTGGWQWTSSPTPAAINAIMNNSENSETDGLPKEEKSVNNTLAALTGANSDNNANQDNPWFLFLTAVAISVIAAAIVLLIKFKLYKNNVRT